MNWRFKNGIYKAKADSAAYIIYAHLNARTKETYIGYSHDPDRRWERHVGEASKDSHHRDTHHPLKKAIGRFGQNAFVHIVLATANDEDRALDIEAAAINYYQPAYNKEYPEHSNPLKSYKFVDFTDEDYTLGWVSGAAPLEKRKAHKKPTGGGVYVDIIAESYKTPSGKISMRAIPGQKYSQDMGIECPRPPRYENPVGTKFRLQVTLKKKGKGKEYLFMPRSWPMEVVD